MESVGSGWHRIHVLVAIDLGVAAAGLRMAGPGDGDALWAARSGIDILRTGNLPHHDTYSWSAPGHPWIPNSWAWNVLLGGLYDLVGTGGLLIAALFLGAVLGLTIAVLARRAGAPPFPTLIVLAVLGVFALGGVPRATVVSVVAAPLLLVPLPDVLTGPRRRMWRGLLVLAAIQVAWMNLHSGALLGPVLVVAFGIGTLLIEREGRSEAAPRLLAAVTIVAAACVATPYGWSLITHANDVRSASVGVIAEWDHLDFSTLVTAPGIAFLVVVLFALPTAYRNRRYDRLLVLVLFVGLAINAVRFIAPLLVLAMPDLALALGRLNVRVRVMQVVAAISAVGLAVAAVAGLSRFGLVKERWESPRLVGELPSGCRLFNDDPIGGAVILLRRDVPVWTDGRNDMYGRPHSELSLDLLDGGARSLRWLDRERVTCVLVRKTDDIADDLAAAPEWHLVDTDDARVLFVR